MNCRTIWALMGLLSFNAQAAFSVQGSSFGADTLITDSTTGLTWLSLEPTFNMRYSQVWEQLGFGGEFAGFNMATYDQVNTLAVDWGVGTFANSGDLSVVSQPGAGRVRVCPECVQSALAFGALFGPGAASALGQDSGQYLAWGQILSGPPGPYGQKFSTYIGINGGSSSFEFEGDGVLNYPADSGALPWIGTWLVTTLPPVPPVPEPSTYALVLTGLGAIAFVNRRRKK